MTKGKLTAAAAALAAVCAPHATLAAGFALQEGSASAIGASFSGATAGANDITYTFWNPAALRSVEGLQIGGAAHALFPTAEGDLSLAGRSVDGALDALVPASYAGVRLGEDVVFGVSVSSPFGLATEYERGSFAPTTFSTEGVPVRSALTAIEIAPMISYDVASSFTIAGGPTIIMGDLIFETFINDTVLGTSNQELVVSDTAVGFQLGMLWEPIAGTRFGASYHSGYSLDASGELEISGATGALAVLVPEGDYAATFGADLPATFSLGVTQMVGDRLRLQAEARWQDWSAFDGALIQTALSTSIEQFNYEDAWLFAVGAEYAATDALTLRSGIAHDATPTTDETRSPRIPDQDRLWLSFGGTFDLNDRAAVDFGYTYIVATSDAPASVDTGEVLTLDGPTAHIVSIGGSIDF